MAEATDDNTVLVGSKPHGVYREAVMRQFLQGETEVTLKARGDATSKALDVSEYLANNLPGVDKGDVDSGTETIELDDDDEDDEMDLSTLEIEVVRDPDALEEE